MVDKLQTGKRLRIPGVRAEVPQVVATHYVVFPQGYTTNIRLFDTCTGTLQTLAPTLMMGTVVPGKKYALLSTSWFTTRAGPAVPPRSRVPAGSLPVYPYRAVVDASFERPHCSRSPRGLRRTPRRGIR